MKTKPTYRLENWSIGTDNPYQPPECSRLRGIFRGERDGFIDGEPIVPTTILEFEGNVITTRNSKYELGDPDPEYVKFCAENNLAVPTVEHIRKSWEKNCA